MVLPKQLINVLSYRWRWLLWLLNQFVILDKDGLKILWLDLTVRKQECVCIVLFDKSKIVSRHYNDWCGSDQSKAKGFLYQSVCLFILFHQLAFPNALKTFWDGQMFSSILRLSTSISKVCYLQTFESVKLLPTLLPCGVSTMINVLWCSEEFYLRGSTDFFEKSRKFQLKTT